MPYLESGVGHRNTDTSQAAAHGAQDKAPNLRTAVLQAIRAAQSPISADEIAEAIGAPYVSVRPRVTELKNDEMIQDSGFRGETRWGRPCILWQASGA